MIRIYNSFIYMIQSPQWVRHCAWAIRHETEIKFIIIIIIIIIIITIL